MTFFSLLFCLSGLCLAAEGSCASSSRTILDLSEKDFAYIAGDYIDEKKISYSAHVQMRMEEQKIGQGDIERVLRDPERVKAGSDANKYNIVSKEVDDGSQLQLGVLLEPHGQLKIFGLIRIAQKNLIPQSKEDFIPFIRHYLDQKKLHYALYSQQYMEEQGVTESGIEHALKNPLEVERKIIMQDQNFDSKVHIKGVANDGKEWAIGLFSTGKKLVVTFISPILNNQIPSLKKDFIRFIRDYLGDEGKKIVYTHRARERMNEFAIDENDVEYILKHPTRVIYRSNHKGFFILGPSRNGRPYRLMLTYDGQIAVFSMDGG